ncbi:unnamed protein product [Urochloa decumbens]|uniref:F-box domain-containing protein n=1 Tax=Urochloa decumbens TaxID=240449 RepID=A0ABC8YSG7_9POAL
MEPLLPPSEDRLMALPDDVLVLILEKLGGGAREAIRTCSLVSRRWSRLPWLLPEPKISVQDFLPRGTELHGELALAELGRAMGAFCRAVSSFLSNSNGTATTTMTTTGSRCLNLEFVLANGCLPTIQRLLGGDAGGTAAGKAGALKFSIRTVAHETDCGEAPMRRYARRFERFMAASSGAFRLLASLELHNLWLGSAGVAAVLGACPRLQRLALRHCHTTSADGGRRGEALVIDDAPALGELVLQMCFYRLVELRSAPKLTRLTCDMWSAIGAPLSLTGVPGLETLVLANPSSASPAAKGFRLSKLLSNATSLHCLSLNFHGEKKHFCNGEDYSKERKYSVHWTHSNFRHNHLKILRVFGFEIEDNKYLTFIKLVMERASNLKTVVLADEEPCNQCGFASDLNSSRCPKNSDEKCFTVKQLKNELSSSVEIYIR